MFFERKKLKVLLLHLAKIEDSPFRNIFGYDDNKRLFRMALHSNHNCCILLTGAPASANTLFLQSLKLKDSHFFDCSNATKSGVIEYIFEKKTTISSVRRA